MKIDFNSLDEELGPRTAEEKHERDLARVKALLDDAREAAADKAEEAHLRNVIQALARNTEARTGEDRHASVVTMYREKEDGELEAFTFPINAPSEAMNTLMDQRPMIFTQLVWSGLSIADREEAMDGAGVGAERAMIMEAFMAWPEATRDYCLSWQRMINTGECWTTSQTIGERGEWMIGQGFCLLAPEATDGPLNVMRGRDDLPAGKPGTAAFVRAMMGETYLTWLIRNEPPGEPRPLN